MASVAQRGPWGGRYPGASPTATTGTLPAPPHRSSPGHRAAPAPQTRPPPGRSPPLTATGAEHVIQGVIAARSQHGRDRHIRRWSRTSDRDRCRSGQRQRRPPVRRHLHIRAAVAGTRPATALNSSSASPARRSAPPPCPQVTAASVTSATSARAWASATAVPAVPSTTQYSASKSVIACAPSNPGPSRANSVSYRSRTSPTCLLADRTGAV